MDQKTGFLDERARSLQERGKDFLAFFYANRYPLLGRRKDSFLQTFEYLLSLGYPRYNILETGCMRQTGNWDGDGCSTIIFDDFCRFMDGSTLTSFDINEGSVELAQSMCRSHRSRVICGDSIVGIRDIGNHPHPANRIHLLYLDSYDVDFGNLHPSAKHHLEEVCTAMHLLSQKALVVVDDSPNQGGKGLYVIDFLLRLGGSVLFSDYQVGIILP